MAAASSFVDWERRERERERMKERERERERKREREREREKGFGHANNGRDGDGSSVSHSLNCCPLPVSPCIAPLSTNTISTCLSENAPTSRDC